MAITQTTITAAVTSTQTTIPVASVTGITAPNFQTGAGITYLLVDQELMQVAAAPVGLVVPVVRGYNSSLAAAHVSGQLVSIGTPADFPPTNETIGAQTAGQANFLGFTLPAVNLGGSADALPNNVAALYVVKTAGVDAMTLTAPPASAEGIVIGVISDTTNAHTITATSLLANGTALKTTATFAAFRGAGIWLRACNGVWEQIMNTAVTLT